jgi:acyl-CoA reductase-like NAD-dependent aldehyde dehydrogenase
MTTLQSVNARTGQPHGKPQPASTPADVEAAVQAAASVAKPWACSKGSQRATLLQGLADALEKDREALIAWAELETALGPLRLNAELERSIYQLRHFANLAKQGAAFPNRIDPAVPGSPPVGHPHLQRVGVPLGPVAVFAAGSFPFGMSVLGSDTGSALAAGCPVVVKAHPGHPGLSQRIMGLAQQVLQALKLPVELLGLVQGASHEVGLALVRHPQIAAVTFTGSTSGGRALHAEAQARSTPIPFYGQLSAINPLVALPAALAERGAELAATLAASIGQGSGQYCTNPGVIVLIDGPESDAFVEQLSRLLALQKPQPMLSSSTRESFDAGVRRLLDHGALALLAAQGSPQAPGPHLLQVSAERFVQRAALRDEVFGPSSLLVRASKVSEVLTVLKAVRGSLTVTLWGADEDTPVNRVLVRGAMEVAGRVLFSGVPIGVSISPAQHHGGPWPATTAPMATAIGDAALERFLRPVCLQDAPAWLQAREGRGC